MLIKLKKWTGEEWKESFVRMPVVPRIEEYVEHEPSKMRGNVKDVTYWWNEEEHLEIIVTLK